MVIEELYKVEAVKPRIIFVEGLDIWIPDNFKMEVVSDVLQGLQETSERYNFALISTLGSPKKSKKDQYDSPRDAIYGSSVFARMTETIVKVSEDYETGGRKVLVLPRNEAPERFDMTIRNGRAVVAPGIVTDITPVAPETQEQAFHRWLTPEATWEQAEERFGIKRSTFFKWKARSPRTVESTPSWTSPRAEAWTIDVAET
jgi:hypothetical protein